MKNLGVFSTGVAAALLALFVVSRFHAGEKFLLGFLQHILGAGPGSDIRVVGGSIKIYLSGGYQWNVQTNSQLQVQNADASSFAIENVNASSTGKPMMPSYNLGPNENWSVDVTTLDPMDPNRGVTVKGSSGATPSTGTVEFDLINNHDRFDDDKGDKKYTNTSGHCGSGEPKCEKVNLIVVHYGGSTDTWHCVDPNQHCHVDIGSQP